MGEQGAFCGFYRGREYLIVHKVLPENIKKKTSHAAWEAFC